jgi:hypothetical protein
VIIAENAPLERTRCLMRWLKRMSEKKFLEIIKIRLERSADFIGLTKQQIEDIADVLQTVLVDYKIEEW